MFRRPSQVRRFASRRSLHLETLETRRLMAAGRANFDVIPSYNPYATAAVSAAGDVVINGSSGADNISVSRYGFLPDSVFVSLNGSVTTLNLSNNGNGKLVFNGNEGDDQFSYYDSTANPMRMLARGGIGNDVIYGGRANDQIFGDEGNDDLYGGDGDDYLVGGNDNDQLHGDAGYDYLYGDLGNDVLWGGTESDQLAGGAGNDWLYGEGGFDQLDGGQEYDFLYGGSEADTFVDDALIYGSSSGSNYVGDFQFIVGESVAASHFAWSEYVQDDSLRGLVRDLTYRDRALDRNDMLQIFVQAGGTQVTDTEFRDLQYVVNSAINFQMPEYVRVLSTKVVNGDVANSWYSGGSSMRQALGNLASGSSGSHLSKLVDKWFKGADRPIALNNSGTAAYTYQQANGAVFALNGTLQYTDIRQGDADTCYFLAALATTASTLPQRIRDMFIDNQDNTYTVRFYVNGTADYVTVDKFLPVNAGGNYVYANRGMSANTFSILWGALAEKAYAQMNESGRIGQDGTNSYQGVAQATGITNQKELGIGWGSIVVGLNHVTGSTLKTLDSVDGTTFNKLMNAWLAGKQVSVREAPGGVGHALAVVGRTYNNISMKWDLLIYDPYGTTRVVSASKLSLNYTHWAIA